MSRPAASSVGLLRVLRLISLIGRSSKLLRSELAPSLLAQRSLNRARRPAHMHIHRRSTKLLSAIKRSNFRTSWRPRERSRQRLVVFCSIFVPTSYTRAAAYWRMLQVAKLLPALANAAFDKPGARRTGRQVCRGSEAWGPQQAGEAVAGAPPRLSRGRRSWGLLLCWRFAASSRAQRQHRRRQRGGGAGAAAWRGTDRAGARGRAAGRQEEKGPQG